VDNFANGIDIPLEENKALENKIKHFIQCGQNAEELNNIDEAIKSFKEALALLNCKSKDYRVFELYFNIGNLYQLSANLEEGLNYFKKAYDAAVIQENKIAQVDTLIQIADSYLTNGELDAGTKYADRADILLKDIDYSKGKLDVKVYWSRFYYIRKEHYKAREICNEALKLCGSEHLLQKGKVLNTLIEIFRDMTSIEEHLDLLSQAYECFEKANYQRGVYGTLNNIAAVYAEKLQDYERALEYYYKLKELSENGIYKEFVAISYINIGEMYFKTLRFEEALYWFKEALNKPDGAYLDNARFYINSFLSQISLKLYNYEVAYNYFKEASKEVDKYTHRESTLVFYYKLSAALLVNLGDINKAKTFIKQALSTVEKDESIVKWNVGLIYEQIKLKDARNKTEIFDILQGIGYTLSKYKNKDEILDAVYDTTAELIDMGYMELAISFAEEYNHLEPQSKILKLKRDYINIVKHEHKDQKNIEELLSALETAKHIKDEKIHWKVSCSLGDYYFNNSDLEKARVYYKEAYDIIKGMQSLVPEEFREGFMKYNYLVEPFNKLTNILNIGINEGI
jgi:tetratricopeptide (TPR) repeat protein